MSIRNYHFYILLITFIFSNCAPSFDLKKEAENIIESFSDLSSPEKRVDIFYPDSYNKDSIKNILKENKFLIDLLKGNFPRPSLKINNVSSTITLQNRLFKLINTSEIYKLNMKQYMLSESDLKKDLDNNLIDYVENGKYLTITKDSDFIAIYHKNSWEYFDFNVSMMYHAYGLKDTKKLVQLYYDEIFVPAEEKWDAESVQNFKETYQEIKDGPQYKDLDFNAYCDCLIQHEEKLDYKKISETNYYESETRLNIIYSCRILTSRE